MSDYMDGPALRALYTEYCKPARVLDRLDDRLIDRMCEVMKEYLHSKGRGIVKAANGRAVLFSYGSDGTPLLTWTTIKSDQEPFFFGTDDDGSCQENWNHDPH